MKCGQRANRKARQDFQEILVTLPQSIWAVAINKLDTSTIMKNWLASICWWHYPENSPAKYDSDSLKKMMDDYRSDWNEHSNKELAYFFEKLGWPYVALKSDETPAMALREAKIDRFNHPEAYVYRSYNDLMKKKSKGLRKYG